MKVKTAFIFLWCAAYMPLHAQFKYSLKDCIQLAWEKSLQLKQSLLSQQISTNNYQQAKKNLLPTVGMDLSGGLSLGNSINPLTYEFSTSSAYTSSVGISTQFLLFSGFQQINTIDRTRFLSESAQADVETFKNNLALTVANNYLQLILAKETIEAAKIQARNNLEQVNRTKSLIDAGVLPKGNMLELQAQTARDELNLVKAQSSYQLLDFQMKQLLLLPTNQDIVFEQEFKVKSLDYDIENVETILNNAVNKLPQIKSEELKLKASKKQMDVALGAFSPTLSFSSYSGSNFISTTKDYVKDNSQGPVLIGFGLDTMNNSIINVYQPGDGRRADGPKPYLMQLKDNLSHRLTLSMNIPIFSKFQRMTNVSNAKLQYMSQNLQLDIAKNKLKEEIYTAYIQYKNAKKTYYAAEENTKAMNNAFEFAKEKYNLGSINSYEYNTSLTNKQNADLELLKSKYEYFFRKVVLDFYNGSVLNLD